MLSINKEWVAEARILASTSLSVSLTMSAQLAISVVETMAVARLGLHALAGVTTALSLYLLVFLLALGVVTAITPIAAQALGRGDTDAIRRSGQQALWIGLILALLGTTIVLSSRPILATLLTGAEAENASDYLLGAAWGLPAWVCYVAVRGLAVATGRVRMTSVVMLAAVPMHAGLTWWLVFGGLGLPSLGAFGAGLAYSLTAMGAWVVLIIMLRLSPTDVFVDVFRPPFVWDGRCQREILRLGIPFAIRIVLREGVLPAAALAMAMAPFGPVAVAAHAVASRTLDLLGVLSFGISDAANMRVGHSLGAGRLEHAGRAGWVAVQLAAVVSLLLASALIAEPRLVARWFLGAASADEIEAASALLPLAACLLFLEGVQSAAGGALSGMRDARGPLLIAASGSWLFGMPLGCVLARTMPAPAQGLWTGLVAGACLTTSLYLLRLRRKLLGNLCAGDRA